MNTRTAIIGAGIMGRGMALVYALGGCHVSLFESDTNVRRQAMELIRTDLALMVEEGLYDASRLAVLDNIFLADSLEQAVEGAASITEAIPEKLELKWQLFARLEELAGAETLISSNTSTLPLSQLNRHMNHPERLIITHFFNPAHLVPLVEVVSPAFFPRQRLESVLAFLRGCGKTPVVLKKEVPGFIANRLQAAVVREALHLAGSGVADLADIDAAMTCGPGFRWSVIGPLETADFGGLDTWQSVMDNLAPVLDDATEAPELIRELNRAGQLGVKTGQGFYRYPDAEAVADKIKQRNLAFIRLLALRNRE